MKTLRKKLTVNDIVSPGDILDLLRVVLARVHTLDAVVIITLEGGELTVEYAGLEGDYHALGLLEAVKPLILDGDDEDD